MESRGIARSASLVGAATLLSRILGLFRDMVILKLFGIHLTDAFYAAFRLPNTLRYLMGEGALSAAFIPVFSDYIRNKSRRDAWELATSVMCCLLVVSGAVTIVGVACAPWMVRVMLAGFSRDPGKFALTVNLTRIMFPYLIFVSMMALCMGILNSLRHFAIPSLAQAAFNLTVIIFAVYISPHWGMVSQERIYAVALGVLVGGMIQLLMQFPVLRRKGFYPVLGRIAGHPELRRIGRLIIPALAGLAVYHVDLLVDNIFASYLPEGSITYLYAANRLIQFPIGTFVIGISTVVFPMMASYVVAGDMSRLKEIMNYALRLTIFITVPAGVGLIVLGKPIIRLVYERGAFLADHSTDPTYLAVMFYAMGVFAIGGVSVLVRCFYSLEDTKTPVLIATVAIVANAIMDYILMKPLLHGGLALSTSISTTLNFSLLVWYLRRKIGKIGLRKILGSLCRILVATTAMAVVAHSIWRSMLPFADPRHTSGKLAIVFVPLLAAIACYVVMAYFLKSPELRELWHEFRRREPGGSSA